MFQRLALAMLLSLPFLAYAETRYISDELTVPLRRGPSNSHKVIHAGLPSGTPLEIIGEDKDAGFTEVRMQNGTSGWLPTQYLTAEPIARDRLASATKRMEALTTELSTLRQTMKSQQNTLANAEVASSDLNKQVKQQQTELMEIRRASANAVAMYEENKSLKADNEKLKLSIGEQEQQIKSLKSGELEILLLTGAGLVVLGLTFGIAIKSRPKNRAGW